MKQWNESVGSAERVGIEEAMTNRRNDGEHIPEGIAGKFPS